MELSDDLSSETSSSNAPNVVRGHPSDIRINFRNKVTITAPKQNTNQPIVAEKPVTEPKLFVAGKQTVASRPNLQMIPRTPYTNQNAKIPKSKNKAPFVKKIPPSQPSTRLNQYPTQDAHGFYPKGIPRSFLEQQSSSAQSPAPPAQVFPTKSYPAQENPTQAVKAQAVTAQAYTAQATLPQVYPTQKAPAQAKLTQSYPAQTFSPQSFPTQASLPQVTPAQANPAQAFPAQATFSQAYPDQAIYSQAFPGPPLRIRHNQMENQRKPTMQKGHHELRVDLPDWMNTLDSIDQSEAEEMTGAAAPTNSKPAYIDGDTVEQSTDLHDFNLESTDESAPPQKRSKIEKNYLELSEEERKRLESEKYLHVKFRPEVVSSEDETVRRWTQQWPWDQDPVASGAARSYSGYSKHISVSEFQKNIIEESESRSSLLKVAILDFPEYLSKEELLDILLEQVKDKMLIPCFIEHTPQELRFLTNQRQSIQSLLKSNLRLDYENHIIPIKITLTMRHWDLSFANKAIRRKLECAYDGEVRLDLRAFCLEKDFVHVVYFPLSRTTNQAMLRQLNVLEWKYLMELDLSSNKLKTLDGFDLANATPKLSRLNLSDNLIEKLSILLSCRGLTLKWLNLEGNPVCMDYNTNPDKYVKIIRNLFPTLKMLDDVQLPSKGTLPPPIGNHCPLPAKPIVERYVQTFYPLIERPEQRLRLIDMYAENCVMTVTHGLMYTNRYRSYRSLLSLARCLAANNTSALQGARAVALAISKWPPLAHDRQTFQVDVLMHDDTSTTIQITGAVKTLAATLADDEQLLSFSRIVVLSASEGHELRIQNEMLHLAKPSAGMEERAFAVTEVMPTTLQTKLDHPPSEEIMDSLTKIMMTVSEMDYPHSKRCLEIKQWDIRAALEHFIYLLNNDKVHTLDVKT